MRRIGVVVYSCLLVFTSTICYGQTLFQKSWGDSLDDAIYSAVATRDGGFVISGYTQLSNGPAVEDEYLAKLCPNGTIEWSKRYGTSQVCQHMKQTRDGGFILCGFGFFKPGFNYATLVKTDSLGNMQWEKDYPCTDDNMLNYVQQTKDGGYIATGFTRCYSAGNYYVLLMKTDANGNLIWSKSIGETGEFIGNYVQQNPDGDYIIAGQSTSQKSGASEAYLVKTDSNGDVIWTRAFDGTASAAVNSICSTPDKGYILAGTANFFTTHSDGNVYVVKTDSNGTLEWSKIYGSNIPKTSEGANDIEPVPSGGYIIAGTTSSYGAGADDAYIIRIDTGGGLLWSKVYGGPKQEVAYSVIPLPDKGFFIGGETVSFSNGSSDFYVIRTDSMGNCGCYDSNAATQTKFVTSIIDSGFVEASGGYDSTIILTESPYYPPVRILCGDSIKCEYFIESTKSMTPNNVSFDIYPNPVSHIINISTDAASKEDMDVKMYSSLGELVYSSRMPANADKFTINVADLATGLYCIVISGSDTKVVKMVTVVR